MNSIGKCRISKKIKALRQPAKASPRSGKKPLSVTVIQHLVIERRHDEAISLEDSFMEIASADEKSASQRRIF